MLPNTRHANPERQSKPSMTRLIMIFFLLRLERSGALWLYCPSGIPSAPYESKWIRTDSIWKVKGCSSQKAIFAEIETISGLK